MDIARPALRHNSWDAYRIAVRVHAIPPFGNQRLDKLRPDHLQALYNKMIASGRSASTAHQVHRTLRPATCHAPRQPARSHPNPEGPPRAQLRQS